MAVPFTVAISDENSIVSVHISAWNLAEWYGLQVVVLVALGSMVCMVLTTGCVVHGRDMDPVLV